MSVKETPNVVILKEVTTATVSTATTETCVRTLTSAPVGINAIRGPDARTLREITLVAAKKGTLELALLVYAVNVTTLSVLITRSASRQELKSANVRKVFTSTIFLFVSTLTSVKWLYATSKSSASIRKAVMLVMKSRPL